MSIPFSKSNHVFYCADFPGLATHCPQAACGFSLYKGVLVQWDEDRDERIYIVLDEMDPHLRDRLLIVQEHKGSVSMVWAGSVPVEYAEGTELLVEGDIWYVLESNTPKGPPVPAQQRNAEEEDIPF